MQAGRVQRRGNSACICLLMLCAALRCAVLCCARLDVDKLDYLKRDNSACGELTTSEFSSLYENMKVGASCDSSAYRLLSVPFVNWPSAGVLALRKHEG